MSRMKDRVCIPFPDISASFWRRHGENPALSVRVYGMEQPLARGDAGGSGMICPPRQDYFRRGGGFGPAPRGAAGRALRVLGLPPVVVRLRGLAAVSPSAVSVVVRRAGLVALAQASDN